IGANISDGFNYIKGSSTLSGLMLMATVPTVLAMPYIQMMPVFARDVLDVGASGLGILMAVSGAGALIGSLLYAAFGMKVQRQGLLLISTAAGFGVVLALFAITPWFLLALVLVALTSGISAV